MDRWCPAARRPSAELNAAILAVLGRARAHYKVVLHGFAVLSNHVHFLLSVADGRELASFMRFVNGNISKAVGRLHNWRGPVWSRRYRSIPVVDEASQVSRLRYLLAQGCKEGLVDSPLAWPGLHCARALLGHETLSGTWLDRSALYHALRDRGADVDVSEFQTSYPIELAPLPCWSSRVGRTSRAADRRFALLTSWRSTRTRGHGEVIAARRRWSMRRPGERAKRSGRSTRRSSMPSARRPSVFAKARRRSTFRYMPSRPLRRS